MEKFESPTMQPDEQNLDDLQRAMESQTRLAAYYTAVGNKRMAEYWACKTRVTQCHLEQINMFIEACKDL
ncbi:hypothetical protein GCM10023116_05900 [Kistimonas scapharcae]|uniref:Uncharacterized protein n=1 Tax=Kistimonas scapharcae TaxID=1036133 RepID=A0ABP8UYQ3_9GAMM